MQDAGIPEADSTAIKRSDCDTIFIVCNFQPDKKAPEAQVNDEHALMRFEFLEALVRAAIAKYGRGLATDNIAQAVNMLFTQVGGWTVMERSDERGQPGGRAAETCPNG